MEGEKALRELSTSGAEIEEVFHTASFNASDLSAAKKITEVSEKEMERISGHQSPASVIALAPFFSYVLKPGKLKDKLVFALEAIQDPGNLGTIIRIADWYGIEDIICSESCVDLYNPKTINATMGSFARVKVHYTDLAEALPQTGSEIYACVMDGNNIHSEKNLKPGIILIGNEGHGLSDNILRLANKRISIPRFGKAESLNAAVAAAVVADNLVRSE